LSDGLFGDIAHVAAASECAIEIDQERVPVDTDAGATYEQAVAGGEDYEVCFAAGSGTVEHIRARFEAEFGISLSRIGRVQAGAGVLERLTDGRVRPVTQRGYQHFEE
jgi:thiamine-monophosphate kinase